MDKDLAPLMRAMIKTEYSPVIMRALVINLFMDLEEMRQQTKLIWPLFHELLGTSKGMSGAKASVDNCIRRKIEIINAVMAQYGLQEDKNDLTFFYDEMSHWFDNHIRFILDHVKACRYDVLSDLIKEDGKQ
jgi:hypothetical protein